MVVIITEDVGVVIIYIYIYGEFALWGLLATAGDQLRVFRWAVKNWG
jgi:hypothetical protein